MVERDRLYRLVGIEIEMIVVLVTFFGHVGLLDRGRMNAERAMKRASRRVSASSMLVLHENTITWLTFANILISSSVNLTVFRIVRETEGVYFFKRKDLLLFFGWNATKIWILDLTLS